MKSNFTAFTVFVVHQPSEGELQAVCYSFKHKHLPATPSFPVSALIEPTLAYARNNGLNSVQLLFSPNGYKVMPPDEDCTETTIAITATQIMTSIWTAEGFSGDSLQHTMSQISNESITNITPDIEVMQKKTDEQLSDNWVPSEQPPRYGDSKLNPLD